MKKQLRINVFGSKLQFFIRLVSLSLLFVVVLAFISLFVEFWLLDIYVSFIPQIFITATTMFVVLFALYSRYVIRDGWDAVWRSIGYKEAAVFMISSFFALFIAIYSLRIIDTVPANSIDHNLTVGTYNVLYSNPDIYQAAYFFGSKNTDIVALQEASPEFVEEARKILGFDHVQISDCDCSAQDTEVAVISRFPLSNKQMIVESQNGGILRTEAKIDGKTTVAIYAVHIPPPFSQTWYQYRNDFTQKLSDSLANEELKPVVMGDFNTTIFSPSMQQFIRNTDAQLDNMAVRPWPECSWFGFGQIACARIDHIFASKQFGVGERYIGNGYGSDHRPVVAELLVN